MKRPASSVPLQWSHSKGSNTWTNSINALHILHHMVPPIAQTLLASGLRRYAGLVGNSRFSTDAMADATGTHAGEHRAGRRGRLGAIVDHWSKALADACGQPALVKNSATSTQKPDSWMRLASSACWTPKPARCPRSLRSATSPQIDVFLAYRPLMAKDACVHT